MMFAAWNLIPDFLKKWVAVGAVLLLLLIGFGIFKGVSCLGHKATKGGTDEEIKKSNVPADDYFQRILDQLQK